MATSGSFKTTGYESRHLVFEWTEKSQSVANNTTTISWTLKGAGGDSTKYYMTGPVKVVIDGKTAYSSDTRFQLTVGKLVASGEATLTHGNTGAKSFTASVEAAIYSYSVNCKGSGSWSLDTISRASQPSLITWPETTNDVGNFGDTISIHMNREASAFTHTVRYEFGSTKGTIATNVATGTTWTIPLSLMNQLPAATKGSGRVYVDTYNGDTFVGTKYTGFTAHVPSSIVPTCGVQVLEATAYKTKYGSLVRGLSKLSVKVTGSTSYSSPIASYNTTADGTRYTAATFETPVIGALSTVEVRATVTDKRGRTSAAAVASFAVLNYTAPNITKYTVHRCDADGTEHDKGEYIKVTFSASVTPLNNKNSAAYKLRYKKATATGFTEVTFSDLAGKYTVTDKSYIFAASGNSSYDVEVVVTDDIKTTSTATSTSTAFTLTNWHTDGTGLSFGKVAEKSNTFENALTLNQLANRYAASSPGASGVAGYVLIATIKITAVQADVPITFVLTRRRESTPMTVHVTFANTSMTSIIPMSVKYEGTNYGAFIIQIDDTTFGLLVQKRNSSDTITVQDWYTSDIMQDRAVVAFPGVLYDQVPTPYYRATPVAFDSLIDFIYPVGSVYISYSHNSPATLFGGTWVRIENAFLWGCDSSGTIGQTGGEKTHTLTANEMPSHTHSIAVARDTTGTTTLTDSTVVYRNKNGTTGYLGSLNTNATGGGAAHNNMPPYIQVSIWRRTA